MDQIEEVRQKIDLVQLISETVPLKKAGRNFKACCPFHGEKTPSFMVSPERQIWKCFGCQKGGDAFGFVMETERVEFGEALRILAKKAGITLLNYRPSPGEGEKDKLYQINHLASEFFHYLLLNHSIGKKALTYILERGIKRESLEIFKIGYSPPMWDGLQKYLVGKKGYAPKDLESAGLIIASTHNLSPNSYYDRFRDRLMFPLIDHRGNICGFSGRVLDPTIKEAKYVNTPETLIYHKSELLYPLQITKEDIKKENSAVVVEGELDAISAFQIGIRNVVAIKGSALTEMQVRLLKRFCENLLLSLDADAAGDMAARRGIEIADNLGFNLKVVTLEKYKDPDETAQKEPDYLRERISQGINIYDFYLDSAFKRFRGKTPEEKKKIGQELVPIFSKIQDEIVKDLYLKKLADKLGVNEEAIIFQIEKMKQNISKIPVSFVAKNDLNVKTRLEVLEDYYLSLLFQAKKPQLLQDQKERDLLQGAANLKIVDLLSRYFGDHKKFSSQFFFKILPPELQETFNRLYLIDFGERIEDEQWVAKEITQTRAQLETLKVKEELKSLWEKIKEKGEIAQENNQIVLLTQRLAILEKK